MKPWIPTIVLALVGASFCGGCAAVFDLSAKAIFGAVFIGLTIGPMVLELQK